MLHFAELISPVTIDQFFSCYWEKQWLLINRNQNGFYDSVLTLGDLDRYFQNQQLPATYIKVTKPGTKYLPEQWTQLDVRRDYHPLHIVDVEKLFSLVREGASVVISGGHKSIPSLNSFCSALEQALRFRLQINIYITPPESQGLNLHYDAHDVFILQICGRKHWKLYDCPTPLPVRKQRFQLEHYTQTEPTQTFDLKAGDLVYIPRGMVHEASTSDSNSVHLTLGLLPNYWYHLIDLFAEEAKHDPEFRQALPHGFTSLNDKAQFIDSFNNKLQAFIQTIDVESLLDQQADNFSNQRLKNKQGRFNDLILIDQLNIDSVVSKRFGIDYQTTHSDQHIVVNVDDHQLLIPRFLESTLSTLLNNRAFKIGELQGLISTQGKIEMVKQCVEVGLLKIDSV